MLSANARLLYGNTQHNVASRFLAEIPADLVTHNGAAMSYGESAVDTHTSDLESEPFEDMPRLSVGDVVSHPSFGRGRVSHIDELEAVIEFDKAGSKTLNLNFAHITKI
jgi:DNA helicase-2/ATP-dependent DNA helicase PcrA